MKKKNVTCNVSWVQWKCFTVEFPGYSLYVSKQADRMIGGSSGKKTMNSSYFRIVNVHKSPSDDYQMTIIIIMTIIQGRDDEQI